METETESNVGPLSKILVLCVWFSGFSSEIAVRAPRLILPPVWWLPTMGGSKTLGPVFGLSILGYCSSLADLVDEEPLPL